MNLIQKSKLASKKSNQLSDSDFLDPSRIGAEVEAVKGSDDRMTYMEACVAVADNRNLEIEVVAKLLPKQIKDKILAEASNARLLKPQHRIATLPL